MKAQKILFTELKKMLDQSENSRLHEKYLSDMTVYDAKEKVQMRKFVSWLYQAFTKQHGS